MPLLRETSCGEIMDYSLRNREENAVLRVYLLKANKINKVTYYRLAGRFVQNGQTWEVDRRYSEFLELRNKLIKFLKMAPSKCPRCENYLHSLKLFDFPKKHLFGSKTQPIVNYRCIALRAFLNTLASWTFSTDAKCPSCGGYAFDAVRNFLVDGGTPHEGSSMETISSMFVVESFLPRNSGRGFSIRAAPGRRPSFIAAADSEALRNSLSQSASSATSSKRQSGEDDPYAEFNDYLGQRPTQNNKIGFSQKVDINKRIKPENRVESDGSNFSFLSDANSSKSTESGYVESFRLYNDDDRAAAAPKGRSSRSERNTGNEARSSHQHSRHQHQKSARKSHHSDRRANEALYGSFTSFTSEERGHDPAFEPIVVSITKRSAEEGESETDSEIDVRGLSIAASPHNSKKHQPSGEGLWQPWELAQAA